MGVRSAVVYVDTSFNRGVCQTGYYIEYGEEVYCGSTKVFDCPDNNSAEIMGIKLACDMAISICGTPYPSIDQSFKFNVFNDNITAVTVSDSKYKPSKKANGRFKSTVDIKEWCTKNNVTLHCVRRRRSDPIMKKCDKLSKKYRKEGRCLYLK